jgi:hypothetical protein
MQRLCKHVPATKNIRNNRIIVGRVIFYAVRILPKESLWIFLCNPLPLLGKNSVKKFPPQRFLRGPCRIKGKYTVSSSHNFLFIYWFVE